MISQVVQHNIRPRCDDTTHSKLPHAGLYFASKQASYFAVGKITQEQVDDYARRKGMAVAEAERWLATMLNYEP
jgi:hypothetical protein